jgi:malonyl-CoA O-methyltransferase
LPFAAQQFDLLICALTLSHVPHLSRVLEECARVVQPGGYLLITDFHPDHTRYGWRTAFVRDGVKYYLPTVGYSRADYVEAITASGCVILQVLESLVGDMPEGMVPEEMRRIYADKPFCLGVLAQRPKG